MIATRLPALAVHALLHHRPMTVVGDDEPVQVEIETILHGGTVHLGHETAGLRKFAAVEADLIPDPMSSLGVCREYLPRPPQTWTPSSFCSGVSPRWSAPMTLVVMPDECQSIPMTAPKD